MWQYPKIERPFYFSTCSPTWTTTDWRLFGNKIEGIRPSLSEHPRRMSSINRTPYFYLLAYTRKTIFMFEHASFSPYVQYRGATRNVFFDFPYLLISFLQVLSCSPFKQNIVRYNYQQSIVVRHPFLHSELMSAVIIILCSWWECEDGYEWIILPVK